VLIGRGREDTWYTAEKLEADRAALRARGVAVETQLHPGGHEWTPEFREAAGEFLWRLARRAVT
jgi:predicted esterase